MSDMTNCNYCTLRTMRENLEKTERIVTLDAGGSTEVYVCKKGEDVNLDHDGPHFRAWFAQLTEYCVC